VAAAGLLTESGSRRKRKLDYSSALAYELISQLRSISSCLGAVHSMVGSFGAWYDKKMIARLADKYIGEIRYGPVLVMRTVFPTSVRTHDGEQVAA
jgi:hypothetical protein